MSAPRPPASGPIPDPPRFFRTLARWFTRADLRASVLGDLDAEFETLIREGHTRREARRWYRGQVLRSLGPLLAGRLRSAGGLRASWLDLRLGLRMLRKYPGLTLATILSLAVGIPVGLAPWHAAGLFEADLPVPEGDRVRILKHFDPQEGGWAPSDLADWASWSTGLQSVSPVAAVQRSAFNVDSGDDRDPTVMGARMTASGFELLRVPPHLGRTLGPQDMVPGAAEVVVIGYDLWRTRLTGDPEVIGSTLRISGTPYTVVGVMPEGFRFPYQDHLWLPLRSADPLADLRPALVFGRLADGFDDEAATAEFRVLEARSDRSAATGEGAPSVASIPMLVPFTEGLFGLRPGGLRAELGFYFVQALALMVLVVACVNISMLLLVRTTARARELSVRTALGAGRGRIVGQLFVEAFVLAMIAAGAGLLIADAVAGRLTFISEQLPYWVDLGITWGTSARAALLAALCAAIVGVLPALKVTGGSIQRAIQQASAGRTGVRFGGVASALIVADVALAVVVSGLALAFASGVLRSMPTDTAGTVRGEEYLVAEFRVPGGGGVPGAGSAFEDRGVNDEAGRALLARLSTEPGVRAAAMADGFPGMDSWRARWEVEGVEPVEPGAWRPSDVVQVVPGFFEALRQPIRQGRAFRPGESEEEAPGIVVNLQFADEFLEGRSPLGHRIRRSLGDGEFGPWREIVGVVGGIGNSGTVVRPRPVAYLPVSAGELFRPKIAVHVDGDPLGFVPRLREVAAEIDPGAIVAELQLLSEARSFDMEVFRWVLLGIRLLVAVLIALAASGTYALLSFTISERTHEIAIRSALGAPRAALLRTIGKRAALQLGGGGLLGLLVTGFIYRQFTLDGWSPGTSPLLLTTALGVGVVGIIALLAGIGPARRGLAIEPEEALRL